VYPNSSRGRERLIGNQVVRSKVIRGERFCTAVREMREPVIANFPSSIELNDASVQTSRDCRAGIQSNCLYAAIRKSLLAALQPCQLIFGHRFIPE
jgi:hypothetical protein